MRPSHSKRPARSGSRSGPSPSRSQPDDAVVRVEATGICGSDLHIYHGRVKIEPGFTIGHEFVGTVIAAGDGVTRVARGRPRARLLPHRVRRLLLLHARRVPRVRRRSGCSATERRSAPPGRAGRAGARARTPNLTLRRVPEGMADDVALFAGDVMGTGYHAVARPACSPATPWRCSASGPVGLCAVQVAKAAGAAQVIAVDSVARAPGDGARFGATPVHLTEEDPRAAVKAAHRGPRRGRRASTPSATPRRSTWRCA